MGNGQEKKKAESTKRRALSERDADTPSRSQETLPSPSKHVLKIGKVFDAVIDFKLLSFYDNLSCTLNRN